MDDLDLEGLEEVNKSIFEVSQDSYEDLFNKFETKVEFKGHTIEEWSIALDLKDLRPDFSITDLERYTLKVVNQTNIITTNYSLASSNYIGLKKSVERSMMIAKQQILEEIEEYNNSVVNPANKRRPPSNDKLEVEAYNRILDLQLSLSIAEMFNTFWELQYKRVQMLNNRLTSLSVLKNVEMKTSQNY